MISNRLSRWTLPFFGCALLNFIAAQALILAGVSYPAQAWTAPGTLIVVHLLAIGWLLLLMLGALFQFVPVITSRMLPSQNAALASLAAIELGLVGMICGFAALSGAAPALAPCLPVGGSLVIAGVLIALFDIGAPLLRAHPLPLPGRMVLAGMAFLLATVALGLLMALALTVPALVPYFGPLLGVGVGFHALAGLGGWFTLAAIGVSYKLLPMFTLAPEERGLIGELVHYFGTVGFGAAVVAGLASLWVPSTALALTETAAKALVLVAIALYLFDVTRIYRTRRRREIELHNKAAAGAFVALGLVALLALGLMVTGRLAANLPLLIFIVLFGWLGGLGVTQLYKIVAFLTWLGRFGTALGRGRVPRVQDLVDERRAAPWFVIYFIGVGLAALALLGPETALFRTGVGFALAGTLALTHEYWRAWRGHYAAKAADAPPPLPPFMNQEGNP